MLGGDGFGCARSDGSAEQQQIVPAQDGLVYVPQLLAGFHAQLVDEPATGFAVDGERLGLPVTAVQGTHPQGGERLVVRL